jgi:acetyl esterase/lipase
VHRVASNAWGARVVAMAVTLACLAAASSAAAAGWSIQANPRIGGATDSGLHGVSCPSPTACTAVGAYAGLYKRGALVERWNGRRWSTQPTPSLGRNRVGNLEAVSCPSATECTGVGLVSDTGSGGSGGLAEHWNGERWSAQPLNPRVGPLVGVSCTSRNRCTAIGARLAERWDGRRWSTQRLPSPAASFELLGVSCASATACIAVGGYFAGNGDELTLAERWNGRRWSIQPTPNPTSASTGTTTSRLTAVSCPSPTTCTAVGSAWYQATSSYVTIVEHWDGRRWAIEQASRPEGLFSSVSCGSSTACVAAGGELAESWNGRGWSIQAIPSPTGTASSNLVGVSCAAPTACTAVGSSGVGGEMLPLTERWDGTGCLVGCTLPSPAGAAPLRYRDPVFASISETQNVQYGAAPDLNGNTVPLMLDLYQPSGDTVRQRPAIVWVHGGGYCCGDKFSSPSTTLAQEFAHYGYVTVSINYRQLVPGGCGVTNDHVTQACYAAAAAAQHDAQAAVRWLRANATTYGIDPTRIGIGGESAGAITATLVGLDPQDPGDSGNPGYSSAVDAFMSLSGGAVDGKFTASPGDAAGLLFSGTSDSTVPFAWSAETAVDMLNNHLPAFLEPLAGANHVPYFPPYQSQIDSQTDYFFYDFLDAAHAQGS